jgi:hypothetical protein
MNLQMFFSKATEDSHNAEATADKRARESKARIPVKARLAVCVAAGAYAEETANPKIILWFHSTVRRY